MECYICSKHDDLVHMTNEKRDENTNEVTVECPKCGREEVIGFGIIA